MVIVDFFFQNEKPEQNCRFFDVKKPDNLEKVRTNNPFYKEEEILVIGILGFDCVIFTFSFRLQM